MAWYKSNTNSNGTRDVKTKKENGYGLYDMSGNVCEWCWDWYSRDISSGTPASGSASGLDRCYRGGSWDLNAGLARVAYRNNTYPFFSYNNFGIRLVRTAQ